MSAETLLSLDVVGMRNVARIRRVTRQLAERIAAYMGVRSPHAGVLEIHNGSGTPHTAGQRIHLFRTAEGRLDLSQLPHELVHLVAGLSPERLFSEGLAVDVAARVAPRRCWPSFRLTPDEWVVSLRSRGRGLPRIAELMEAFPVLRLERSAAEGRSGIMLAGTAYIVAGSFVHFLRTSLGSSTFWAGYDRGAMWEGLAELATLESAWLGSLPLELDHSATSRLTLSIADSRRQMERISN